MPGSGPTTPHTLFISDLHLSEARPESARAFIDFMATRARLASALYILGDLFDYWLGDDDLENPFVAPIVSALAAASDAGLPVSFMHGNRDFLIGSGFSRACGVRLLHEPTLVELHGVRTLLMHGDTLCVDDIDYNVFRATVREAAWQREFLSRPLSQRRAEAERLRAISEREKRGKSQKIMDVTEAAVLRVLRAWAYPRLIHGHTHRPMRHLHQVDGHTCERWVLRDWEMTAVGLTCGPEGIVAF